MSYEASLSLVWLRHTARQYPDATSFEEAARPMMSDPTSPEDEPRLREYLRAVWETLDQDAKEAQRGLIARFA